MQNAKACWLQWWLVNAMHAGTSWLQWWLANAGTSCSDDCFIYFSGYSGQNQFNLNRTTSDEVKETDTWGEWTVWTRCSRECGGGRHSRMRDCIFQDKAVINCTGDRVQIKDCNTHECPSMLIFFSPWMILLGAFCSWWRLDQMGGVEWMFFNLWQWHSIESSLLYWPHSHVWRQRLRRGRTASPELFLETLPWWVWCYH